MIELRAEQRPKCEEAKIILKKFGCVYFAGQMRVGKTPTSLMCAYESGWRSICVFGTKKGIPGFEKFNPESMFVSVKIINYKNNYRNIAKLNPDDYDGFIIDEPHNLSAFPIPGKSAQEIKKIVGNKPVIYISGTPTPESYSQIYHQFWLCNHGPFQKYWNPKNKGSGFYNWAKDFCKQYEYKELDEDMNDITKYRVKQKHVYGNTVNDYSEALEEKIKPMIAPYFVTLTQEQAGFTSFVEDKILLIPINKNLYKLMKILRKNKYYRMKSGDEIVVESKVRLQSLYHQLSSGTLNITTIIPNPDPQKKGKKVMKKFTLDESKAYFIKSFFAGKKIAIYYKFTQEGEVLKKVFSSWTDDQDMFNKHEHITFICQMISGREGVNISTADDLVMYNIDFSATTYLQVRERMQEKLRTKTSTVWWAFSEYGIEQKIYKLVSNKLDYTNSYFQKDLKSWAFPE
jgi:hypothetical protein